MGNDRASPQLLLITPGNRYRLSIVYPEEVKVRRLNEIIALQNRLSAESNQDVYKRQGYISPGREIHIVSQIEKTVHFHSVVLEQITD